MSPYDIVIAKPAKKEIAKLPKAAQKLIVGALEGLKTAPRQADVEKLRVNPTFLRLRCGDYRVIYAVDDNRRICVVVVVRDRKDAFKGLETLDAKLANALSAVAGKLLERAVATGTA